MPEKGGEVPKQVELNVVMRHGFETISVGFQEKQRAMHRHALERAVAEHQVKLQEGSDLLSLRVQAATIDRTKDFSSDDESCCLNDDERKAYCETVDQCVDEQGTSESDKESLRVTMTEVIFKPKVYLLHYKRWKSDWDGSPTLQQKYPDFKKYALEQGKKFIEARRNELIASRFRRFQNDSMPKGGTDAERKAKLKEMSKKALVFFKDHEDELLEYSSLEASDPKRQQLFQKFIIETGLQGANIAAAHQLFEEIIGDIEVSFTAEKKLEARNNKMVNRAQKAVDEDAEIDENDWNAMLEASLKDDPFFKEIMQQQQAATYHPDGAEGVSPRPQLDTVQAVAMQAGGLLVMGYDPATDTYKVKYPDSTLITTMKIVPKPGSKSFEDATFIFINQYADKSKGNQVAFDSKTLRSGCNQMFLDYLMNDWIDHNKTSPNFSANDILVDEKMSSMAQRLYGRNLNEVVLTRNMRDVFTRFMEVLMKGDSAATAYGDLGSFAERVKIMDTVLADPQYAGELRREFANVASTTWTVSTLLEHIGYKVKK